LTDFKLGKGVSVEEEDDWLGVGPLQVAMHRNCHILAVIRFVKIDYIHTFRI